MDQPQVPGHVVHALIGRGASGAVWAASRVHDQRRVAVKVVAVGAPGVGADGAAAAAQAVRELAVLARIDNPHVVRLHGATPLADGRLALVLDLVDGGSLAAVVAGRGHLSAGECVTVLAPIARAVADLHVAGVLHGDLSPGNVLFTADGRPMLSDLGVARLTGERVEDVWATTGFVAPEVAGGGQPSPAADVYALGALGWYALTGAAPPPVALRPPLAALAPQAPAELLRVLVDCLAPDPARRPAADQVAVDVFDAAPAEAVRLASGADPAVELTHRLRAAAEPPPVEAGRRSPLRFLASLASAVRAGAGRRPRSRVRPRFALHRPARPGAAAGMLAVLLAAAGVAWWVVRPAAYAAHAAPTAPTTLTAHASPTASAAQPAALLRRRDAPHTDPRGLVQQLADGRADAWTSRSLDDLARVDLPGSAALRSDRADVATLLDRDLRYSGLRFVVTGARVEAATPASATVRVGLVTAAYTVRDRAGGTVRKPASSRTVTLELRWADGGWRIESYR